MKTKSGHKAEKSELGGKPTLVAFLLDRTGSMSSCKEETIKGFNGYIDELKKQNKGEMRFTLTQFDSQAVDIVHNSVPLEKVVRLNEESYQPRALTPLYDAIGKTIRETEKSATDKYKVLFVTLTDGEENSSSEWNEQTAKALIKEKEDKDKWTFAYIGVGLNGFASTTRMSAGTTGASNVLRSSHKNTGKAYRTLATASVNYCCNMAANTNSVDNVFGSSKPTTEDDE